MSNQIAVQETLQVGRGLEFAETSSSSETSETEESASSQSTNEESGVLLCNLDDLSK